MTLQRVCHGSARSLSWLYEESVITLREVRQVGILPVDAEANLQRKRILPRAMTDSS